MRKDIMPFPPQYKNRLRAGKKDITVRIRREVGRYKKNEIYQAQSLSGKSWDVKIKVIRVITTNFKNLSKYVPKRTMKSKDFRNLKDSDKVNVVEFKVVEGIKPGEH